MNTHESFVEAKFRFVSNLVPPDSKVLDIGCGDGSIRNFLKNPDYYGIDGNKKDIQNLAKQKFNAKQADLNKDELPFKKEKFDFVLMLDILEHVANPKKLLLEAKKRLNSTGKIITTLPNDYHILNKLRFILNKHLTEDPFAPYGHLHYFPIKSGKKFLQKNGFEIITMTYLAPIKPKAVPSFIKKILAYLFPQAFVRDVLYVLS
jgi:methionine biosynthesis protein MetW